MKKKLTKKLTLSKETLRVLEAPEFANARGGTDAPPAPTDFSCSCPTFCCASRIYNCFNPSRDDC